MAINQLKAGAVLNYVVLGLNSLVGLLYTPYMLRMMGQSEFGLYSLVASVIAYLTIMDFGFGNAIIRYTAKFRAEGKLQEQYSLFGMLLILYSIIGIIAFGAGLGLYFNVEALFGDTMTSIELERAKILMMIMVFNLAVTFPLGLFGSIVTAYEDFVFQKVVQIIRILLNTVAMVCLLKMGYKAIAMVILQTIFNFATLLLNLFYCKYKIRIKIVFGKFHLGLLKEVAIYSFWIFLNAITERIYWNAGQFVLGIYHGTVAVAIYAVAIQLKDMFYMFSTAISSVFLPRITKMISNGASEKEISELFIRTGRLQYIIISFIIISFILLGRPFINLWAGEGYDMAYIVALLFFISTSVPLIQNLGIIILQARNQLKFRSIVIVTASVLSVFAAIPLANIYGVLGCAVVTSVSVAIIYGLILNIYYHRVIHIDIIKFWREIGKMSIPVVVILAAGLILLYRFPVESITEFIVAGSILIIVYLPVSFCFSMNKVERDLFSSPIKKIILKLTSA